MTERTAHGTKQVHVPSLRDYLSTLRRRKWIFLLAVTLVPLGAVVASLRQQDLYRGTAQVLLSRQAASFVASLTNTPDPDAYGQQPDRAAQTQARVAAVPLLAERTLNAVKLRDRSPGELLANTTISVVGGADLLNFSVTDPVPEVAARLATEYARQFTRYRGELDTAALRRARAGIQRRLESLREEGSTRSELFTNLLERDQELEMMEALRTSNAFLVRSAEGAARIQPNPKRDGFLGLALGLVLGGALVFLWEALDTRARSASEIRELLGLPLLARIPRPPKQFRNERRLVMVDEPNGRHAETFRVLRTNLDFVNIDRRARMIMVTSALAEEGKSTVIANLAVAYARSGKRTILVDLDLRRPVIDRYFDVADRPGLTQVALGQATLDEAIAPLAFSTTVSDGRRSSAPPPASALTGNGNRDVGGVLGVLTTGPLPPDAGEFVGTHVVGEILEQLRERADVVLIDAPPLLHPGDAMTLSDKVDALLVVSALRIIRRPLLNELRHAISTSPAPALGFVLTGAEAEETYGYGYTGYDYYYARPKDRAAGDRQRA